MVLGLGKLLVVGLTKSISLDLTNHFTFAKPPQASALPQQSQ